MTTKKSKNKLTAIDLFSGSGGLTLGLKQAGFKVVGAIDNNEVAMESYKHNHPEVITWLNDIRKLEPKNLLKKLGLKKGELDLLAGCPPCQGFSSIRTFNGAKRIKDKRNDLVFDYLRFVKVFEPKSIMMENVPALAKDRRIKIFQEEIKKLGYKATCDVLNAADYGVPQRRRRMILLAAKNQTILHALPIANRTTVRETIGNMPQAGKSGDILHDVPENRSSSVMDIIRRIPKDGGSRRNMGLKWQLPCHKRCEGGFKDIYGRMKWDDVSPTMTGGCTNPSKGRFLHPQKNRAITLREASLLQSFPPDYFFSLAGGKQGVSLMIGNALPPRFIKHHALAIKKHLQTYA
jgi:DNA (cytosine-5)-methyltransferase 1